MAILFSSCFEIVEEIDHNADGSGSLVYTVNMSQSRDHIKTLMKLDSINGLNVPSRQKIEGKLEQGRSLLKMVKGISNVYVDKDYENFVFTISLDYSSLNDLNFAVELLHLQMSPFDNFYTLVFETTDLSVDRRMDSHSLAFMEYLNYKSPNLLKNSNYTTIYRFENEVEKANSKISKNKKAVMYRYNMAKLAEHKESMHQQIVIKP